MNCDKCDLLLYAVTDRAWLRGRTLASVVEEAIRGGVSMVQLREKELSFDEFLAEAVEIGALCRRYGVPFLVNDNVEIALRSGADGVHVGHGDMPAEAVRRLIGKDKILGVSAETVEAAKEAARCGADYLGVGAVFSTSTKTDAADVSFDTLSSICESVDIPVVAIGGIGEKNMKLLRGSGIAGVALVSAIFASPDIEKDTKKLAALAAETVGK